MFSNPTSPNENINPLITEQYLHFGTIQTSSIKVTQELLCQSISSLKPNSSCGPDGLAANCLRKGGQFIMEALSDIYNMSFKCGNAFLDSKEAWVTPAWKGKSKLAPENYLEAESGKKVRDACFQCAIITMR